MRSLAWLVWLGTLRAPVAPAVGTVCAVRSCVRVRCVALALCVCVVCDRAVCARAVRCALFRGAVAWSWPVCVQRLSTRRWQRTPRSRPDGQELDRLPPDFHTEAFLSLSVRRSEAAVHRDISSPSTCMHSAHCAALILVPCLQTFGVNPLCARAVSPGAVPPYTCLPNCGCNKHCLRGFLW